MQTPCGERKEERPCGQNRKRELQMGLQWQGVGTTGLVSPTGSWGFSLVALGWPWRFEAEDSGI